MYKSINEWQHEIAENTSNMQFYEGMYQDRDNAVQACVNLSVGTIRYRIMPSVRMPNDPNAEVAFTVMREVVASGRGKFTDAINAAKQLGNEWSDYIDVQCLPSEIHYLRQLVSNAKANLRVQVVDGGARIFKKNDSLNKTGRLKKLLQSYNGNVIVVNKADYQPAYVRVVVSQWNSEHGTDFSVTTSGDTVRIYVRYDAVMLHVDKIEAAKKALSSGTLTLEQYDAAIEQWEQLKAKIEELLKEPLWRREFARHI
jgi:hypothetical protein